MPVIAEVPLPWRSPVSVEAPVPPPPTGRPVAFVSTRAEGVPRAGVMSVGEVARTTSPVPVHVKREEVAIDVASAVAPVMLPRMELAETWARFANGRSPVIASVSARSSAPHAYVEAPVTRRTWPAVDESVMPAIAEVPLPWRSPVRVEAPVPPPATPRSPARGLAKVRVVPEPVTVVEAVRPLKAVLDVAMTRAPVNAEPVGPRERTPVFVTLPPEDERPEEKVVVATHAGMPPDHARTCPPVPCVVVERALVPAPYGMAPVWILPQPVPPLPTRSGVMRVRAPVESKVEVAVAPKYALLKTENWLVEAFVNASKLGSEK